MRRLYRYQYAFIMLLSCVCSLFMITVVQNELGSGAWIAFFLCLVPGMAVGAFFFGAVFRLAVNICAICRCMKDTLGLRSEKNLALPVAGLMVGLSQLLTVSEEVIGRYLMHIYPYIALFPALVLPLITLGLSRKRRRVWR